MANIRRAEIEMEPAPIVVDFPLRGEWVASHTPAEQIPSHGTDALGQRYAYDFLRIERERKGWKFFRVSALRYFLLGVKLNDCYGWGQPIHAPFAGTVIAARDGWRERKWLHFLRGFAIVLKVLLRHPAILGPRRTNDLRHALGNYIILKKPESEIYAFFAHARQGSIRVVSGEEVWLGQQLAEVGHSGNSTTPHLHFHLMDSANILTAQGLPCRFREYEALKNGVWCKATEGTPAMREFIRDTA